MFNRSYKIIYDILFHLLVFLLSYGAWDFFLVTATLEGNLEEWV